MGYNQNNAGISSIVYIYNKSKKITCKDCTHYNKYDKSCAVTATFPPHDGWDSWKYCKKFNLTDKCDNYKEKQALLKKMGKNNPQTLATKKRKDHSPSEEKNISNQNEMTFGKENNSPDFGDASLYLYDLFKGSVRKKHINRLLKKNNNDLYKTFYAIYVNQIKHLVSTYGLSIDAAKCVLGICDFDLRETSKFTEKHLNDLKNEQKVKHFLQVSKSKVDSSKLPPVLLSKEISDVEIFKKVFDDLQKCNFIVIWEKKGQSPTCLCGGIIDYNDKVEIKYHDHDRIESRFVPGKICRDCGRKYVTSETIRKSFADIIYIR